MLVKLDAVQWTGTNFDEIKAFVEGDVTQKGEVLDLFGLIDVKPGQVIAKFGKRLIVEDMEILWQVDQTDFEGMSRKIVAARTSGIQDIFKSLDPNAQLIDSPKPLTLEMLNAH